MPLPEVAPNVFLHADTCNVWVIRDGPAAILVDLGDGSVFDALARIGVERVEWVLFTHHHREQCQGYDRLAAWAAEHGPVRIGAPDGRHPPPRGRPRDRRRRDDPLAGARAHL
jgi:glyoxylase-like metal-dependent hydrolase (beta-lactamase superfamily II)